MLQGLVVEGGEQKEEDEVSQVYCGIDWAEDHHDVAVVDQDGRLLSKARISDDVAGYQRLLDLLVEHGDAPGDLIPVAIETVQGLLVATLRASGREVFAINPLSAARYRDRHGVSRKKSDPGDALVLANVLRTDAAMHRPLPADSDLVKAISVLARAQQDAVWARQQLVNQVRSLLRQYFPGAIEAFGARERGFARPDARAVLSAMPTPARAAAASVSTIRAALRRAGRKRGIERDARILQQAFRREQARQPRAVEDAMGRRLSALITQLDAACAAAQDLQDAVDSAFAQHPDAAILLSFPGLGVQLAARVLAEIGDDRARFTDARGLKAYAGSAPVTRTSGKRRWVGRRHVKNNRLSATGFCWALSALTASPAANAHYRRRRATGDWHAQAQRHLFNRLLGQLYYCLQHNQTYDEHRAFGTPPAEHPLTA